MKFSVEERSELKKIADSINVPFEALLAVISVESNGIKGEMINGRLEPLIRYEGHYFDKLCAPSIRESARKAGVSAPKAGQIKNPKAQINRWTLVKKAATFDRVAAYSSCSYGVGQVMGSHWKVLGYKSIDDLIEVARSGLVGQAKLMAQFIKHFGLDDELRALDWSGFARGYNGKNYKVNKYDTKLAAAYASFGGSGTVAENRSGFLRLGSKGAGVRDLQALLNLAGYKVTVDGDFGTGTQAAVKALQTANKLKADGIVGPKTQAVLTTVRALAPDAPGQEKVLEIDEVQKGLGTAIGVPAVLTTAKEGLESIVTQISPYAYLAKVTEYLQTGIAVISVVTIVAGAGYAVYGWWKSRQSDTGTKADNVVINYESDDDQLVLPM